MNNAEEWIAAKRREKRSEKLLVRVAHPSILNWQVFILTGCEMDGNLKFDTDAIMESEGDALRHAKFLKRSGYRAGYSFGDPRHNKATFV